jgi:hypothetical protein
LALVVSALFAVYETSWTQCVVDGELVACVELVHQMQLQPNGKQAFPAVCGLQLRRLGASAKTHYAMLQSYVDNIVDYVAREQLTGEVISTVHVLKPVWQCTQICQE